jgi:hypothetical protein
MEGVQMSDTPRADAVDAKCNELELGDAIFYAIFHFEKLERELNTANAIIRQQQLLDEENLRLKDRIKRLEEVLESIRKYCIREYCTRPKNEQSMVDACCYAIDTAAKALKAKEAKP